MEHIRHFAFVLRFVTFCQVFTVEESVFKMSLQTVFTLEELCSRFAGQNDDVHDDAHHDVCHFCMIEKSVDEEESRTFLSVKF